ncbi:respiratory chain complex I subunit 1 family protein [Desulfosporosinus sp. BICA1-9]|uniref:respiratory chain complex I subunit 1 family protein n=1 Tax=Desulfosporosinus sp. BICA1-9 TaxID=1531958 RepID=UPI00054C35F9|nr:NADH-quinone oxidoreductase subunit H [Desulfosporosinus sp. BICA1-9]KJS80549.1 MAG: formate hydrogenlyase [Desulfosporosinus sp. BICA1-9]KJS89290.1 MAG: formate hydrogenlyase [Desulfosporosinus sp. BICA1-9]HBW38024.1 formate hydrogenlyase [Desulfosporosinus sp.]
MLREAAIGAYQIGLILLLAPLLTGIIKKTKAFFQTRKGPTIFQPYFDLYKYLQKESVVSEHTSWIFRVTPLIYLSSMLVVAAIVPVVVTQSLLAFTGDLILVVYLFALARFFLALAGVDAGSAFGGMGSSREMAVAAIAEPAFMLPLFTMAVAAGTSNLTGIVQSVVNGGEGVLTVAHLMSFVALFVVAVAETGRIPVDNPDTHLELTMLHEGMLLEYSGTNLALLSYSVSIKQFLIFTLLVNIFFPWGIVLVSAGIGALILGTLMFILKLLVIGMVMAVVETSFAKARLFKVPDLLLASLLIGLLGLVSKFVFRG